MTTKRLLDLKHTASVYRIPNPSNWPAEFVNEVVVSDALKALKKIPDNCISLAVTSPPYWNAADYEVEGQIGQTDYETFLSDLLKIWKETHRVLIPNGKLAIVSPILPIPKKDMNEQHTRHLKNIASDTEHTILSDIKGLHRYSLFIWQKQTSEKMFGSYPYPPNIYEDNTIEFINVFVKDGPPPPVSSNSKNASKLTQDEWRNLTMQVWPIYPEDVRRAGGHPCPFPVTLPMRLIKMYTFKKDKSNNFAGDIVLDMFNGTGATCVAARATGRNWIGIDLNPQFCTIARHRILQDTVDPDAIFLEGVKVKQAKNLNQLEIFKPSKDAAEM